MVTDLADDLILSSFWVALWEKVLRYDVICQFTRESVWHPNLIHTGVEKLIIAPSTDGSSIGSQNAFCHCTECLFVANVDWYLRVKKSIKRFLCWIVLWYNIVNINRMLVPISWYDSVVVEIIQIKQEGCIVVVGIELEIIIFESFREVDII